MIQAGSQGESVMDEDIEGEDDETNQQRILGHILHATSKPRP